MGKRFDACTPRPKRDGGTWWLKVGSAWQNDEGRIAVYLDAYPVPDEKGRVAVMLFEPREQSDRGDAQKSSAKRGSQRKQEVDDDEIPF